MTEYLGKHREYRADLAVADYPYTDSQFVTNVLMGLPKAYDNLRSQYDWIRAQQMDTPPDVEFLFNRLFIEEENICVRQPTANRAANLKESGGKGGANGKNTNATDNNNDKLKPKGLVAVTDGSTFYLVMENSYDGVNDTRHVSIGPWFPFASDKERELMALYRCLIEHIINDPFKVKTTLIFTSELTPAEWGRSDLIAVRVAQTMLANSTTEVTETEHGAEELQATQKEDNKDTVERKNSGEDNGEINILNLPGQDIPADTLQQKISEGGITSQECQD
ncbi:hypothetical protein CGRA01v4_14258 [Colletotrichum graminicola]|nr:hypothetical protein CGRA01v4_14258 [Colletotrichum graminicola]